MNAPAIDRDGGEAGPTGALIALGAARQGGAWRRWRELTADAPPFLAPEFFALTRELAPDGEALLAEAATGDRMIGALPLVRDNDTLWSLLSDHSPGYDYWGSRDGIDAIWRAVRADRGWTRLVLTKVPRESALATWLPVVAGADGHPVVLRPDTRHPYFALAGFEARMSKRFLANLQRCGRKAGGLELERLAVPTRAALDEALAIEAMGWKGAAGTSIADDPRVTHFYRAITRLWGRRGRAALYFLSAGGRRIASLVAFEDDHTLYALKIAYDPRHANLSPGHLLVWKVAAAAEARGLAELDFVGHDDGWKRKWTDRVHEHVVVVVYQRSARGLVRYALRELVQPGLPEGLRGNLRQTLRSPLPRRCQRADVIGDHTLAARVRGRVRRGLGIKSGLRRALRPPPAREPVGAPSRFPAGSWVRVLDADRLRATLDDKARLRGLEFVATQWETCGKVLRVDRHVRRMRDDHGRFRPIARTVLLEGVDCAGQRARARRLRPSLPADVPRRVARAGRGAQARADPAPDPDPVRPGQERRGDRPRPRSVRPARRADLHARDGRPRRRPVRDRRSPARGSSSTTAGSSRARRSTCSPGSTARAPSSASRARATGPARCSGTRTGWWSSPRSRPSAGAPPRGEPS